MLSLESLETRTTVSDTLLGLVWPVLWGAAPFFTAPTESNVGGDSSETSRRDDSAPRSGGVAACRDLPSDFHRPAIRRQGQAQPPRPAPEPSLAASRGEAADADSFPLAAPTLRPGISSEMAVTPEGYAHHAFVTSAAAADTGSVSAAPLTGYLCPACQVVSFGQTAQTALGALNGGAGGGHGPGPADDGWEASWQAGGSDASGHYMAGTELMQLVAHNGSLFGGTSVRKDSPGKDPVTGAEILRLDSPTGQWQVDHEFSGLLDDGTPRYLRVSVMNEFTFTTDGTGKPLPKPVTLLLASPYDLTGPGVVFSRDDVSGSWTEMVLVQNPPPSEIRALGFHHDPLTGVDYVFAASALTGTFRGVYDSAAPGGIHWDPMPELVRLRRTMAFAEANGAFHQISKPAILRRVDGPEPSWDEVYTYNPPPLSFGLRGLTTIDNPIGPGQVLLAGLEGDPAYVVRFHPNLNYRQIIELNLQDFLQRQWGALDAQFIALAHNDIPEVIDPRNGEAVRLITLDAHNPNQGYQESSWYLIRHADRHFDLREIRPLPNPWDPNPKVEATRTVVVSPFPADQGQFLYFGGYDPTRDDSAHNTAWIYRATIEAALGDDA